MMSAGSATGGTTSSWAYRPALDGLRAVAVALVVVYHSGVAGFAGGFVGVDLFFVLSGFLITNVLLAEHQATGTVSLRRFYARRMRRLLPAAVVMVVLTSLAAGLVETPATRAGFVADARSALLYFANWHFLAGSTDYFAADVDASPFLHFWSLAIEEQFYAVYPLVLLGAFALARRRSWPATLPVVLVTLGLASLVAQVVVAANDPLRAYFATFPRLYQLLAGAALAVSLPWLRSRVAPSRSASDPDRDRARGVGGGAIVVVGLCGLVLVATEVVDVDVSTRGVLAAGSAVITIAALELTPRTGAGRVLGCEPLRFVGRISYGIYLWHWPLILFANRVLTLTPVETLAIAAIGSAALAALSIELIETPLRRSARLDRIPRATIATGLAISLVAGLAVAPHILRNERRPAFTAHQSTELTVDDPVVAAALAAPVPELAPVDAGRGLDRSGCDREHPDGCVIHHGTGTHVHVMGDSNASVLVPVMAALGEEHDLTVSWTTWPGCPWQRGLVWETDDRRAIDACITARDEWYDHLIPALDPDVIVAINVPRDPGTRDRTFWAAPDGSRDDDLVARTTAASLDALAVDGRQVVLIEPLPYARFDPADCLSGAATVGDCAYAVDTTPSASEVAFRSEAARRPNVTSVDADRLACPHLPVCIPVLDGQLVFFNQYHLDAAWIDTHRDDIWQLLTDAIGRVS